MKVDCETLECQHTGSSKSRIVKNIVHEAVKLKDNSRHPPSPSCQHTDSRFPPSLYPC